jgi:hypothetical protein
MNIVGIKGPYTGLLMHFKPHPFNTCRVTVVSIFNE